MSSRTRRLRRGRREFGLDLAVQRVHRGRFSRIVPTPGWSCEVSKVTNSAMTITLYAGTGGAAGDRIPIEIDGRIVELSSPDRVYFPERGETKLDLALYYLAVGDGIVRALHDRPTMLHRFPKGVDGPKVHQKRLPAGAPPWVETCEIYFPAMAAPPTNCV